MFNLPKLFVLHTDNSAPCNIVESTLETFLIVYAVHLSNTVHLLYMQGTAGCGRRAGADEYCTGDSAPIYGQNSVLTTPGDSAPIYGQNSVLTTPQATVLPSMVRILS